MNKKKRFLDCYDDIQKRNEIISILQNYYKIKDIEKNTKFLQIFNDLYISQEKLSYDKISAKYYIGINTLNRYIEKFNTLAEKLTEVK